METLPPPRRTWRTIVRALASLACVGLLFALLLHNTDLAAVGEAIGAMTGLELGALLLVAAWNLVSYWFVQASVLPGLSIGRAAIVTQTTTAVANTLPGGSAVGIGLAYRMYASWGFDGQAIARSLLVSGVWNTFVKLGMPVLALAALAVTGTATAGLVSAALLGLAALAGAVVVLALVLRSDRLARRTGTALSGVANRLLKLVRRPPVGDWAAAATRFRADTIGLLRTRWQWITFVTVVSHVSLYLVLLVALRQVGVSDDEVSWAEVLGAFAFVRLLTALPVTPGGLGVVELGLVSALDVAGGDRELVVAAVLVFRTLTYVLPVPLGAVTYVLWRRSLAEGQGSSSWPSSRRTVSRSSDRGTSPTESKSSFSSSMCSALSPRSKA